MEQNERLLPLSSFGEKEAEKLRWVLCDIDDTITTGGKLTADSYAALWALHEAGYGVIPVTGRPAGWCDLIIREWPVDAVVGENGAFALYFDGPQLKRVLHPNTVPDAQEKLRSVREAVLQTVPGSRVAKDQFSRIYDLAIDFNEDEPHLGLEAAEKIKAVCESMGATAKLSSIHVNAWFGDYDKVSMAKEVLAHLFGVQEPEKEAMFFGDSPNDEPMFRFLPLSCAVANIRPFVNRMAVLPRFVTDAPGAAGFAEGVRHLLEVKPHA